MSESRADLTLAAALRLMAPLVQMLLREGVTYPRFANALKKTFLEAASPVLEAGSTRVNDSSISTLTGVHRKDVREWRAAGQPRAPAKTLGAVMEVFTRWANDPAYCDAQGRPRVLERSGGAGSFEALAAATCKDVHPHTLLRELIRLGVARPVETEPGVLGEQVSLCLEAFVPRQGSAEMLQLFADNVGDHLAVASHNLSQSGQPMLEQAIFADELSAESVTALNTLALQLWNQAFHEFVREATRLSDLDRGRADANQRVRLGMYFYRGPDDKP